MNQVVNVAVVVTYSFFNSFIDHYTCYIQTLLIKYSTDQTNLVPRTFSLAFSRPALKKGKRSWEGGWIETQNTCLLVAGVGASCGSDFLLAQCWVWRAYHLWKLQQISQQL